MNTLAWARRPESWADNALIAITVAIMAVVVVVLAVVILPVALLSDAHLEHDATLRVLTSVESVRAGGAARAASAVVVAHPQVGLVADGVRLSAADVVGARFSGYLRANHTTHRGWAVASVGDGRLVVSRQTRRPVIEAAGLVAVALGAALAILAGGWAIRRARIAYQEQVGFIADATRRIATGETGVRTGVAGPDEIGTLGRHVDEMAAQLETLERARATFIAKVSHDLRTPLTVVRGYAYTLRRHESSPTARARLRRIELETDRLAALVDDLMTLAEASTGALRLEFVEQDAAVALDEVAERLAGLASDRGVQIVRADDDGVHVLRADRRRLVQLVTNLATNAINHAPSGSAVILATTSSGSFVELSVADAGPGIDPGATDRLLRPFERGTASPGGTGLGLAIVRDLVDAHGGVLSFDRREPRGTRAVVALPRRREATA